MSVTTQGGDSNPELVESFEQFLDEYYADAIRELANAYPSNQRSLEINFGDLYRYDPDLATDWLNQPDKLQGYAEEALRLYDLPVAVDLGGAHVRLGGLGEVHQYYPGEFSPTDAAGQYVAITGEISRATDEYSRITEAAFECQRCGTLNRVPQPDGSDFQDAHECTGCERQGPFEVNFDQSSFVDAQALQIQTPPEVANGTGQELDVYVEDDLTDTATVGDRVTICGTLHLEQQTSGQQKTAKFRPYLTGEHIAVEETDHTELEIDADERERIRDLAAGEHGDPLDLAAQSLAPKIYGYEDIKRMLVLAMVGGERVVYPTEDADRGDFHVLLLGDPGTAKSKLVDRVEQLAPRAVGVSGKDARSAGITTAATRDDFGDAEWTLEAGAFVQANDGVVCIDELDDMDPDVRASMLEPMSKQSVHVAKAGINATLSTRAAVVAAGNPKHGRFDQYQPIHEQFGFESALISRFDLIFTVVDDVDEDEDREIADHILQTRDAAKRVQADAAIDDEDEQRITPPVEEEILRKWIAMAKRQPAPVFASDEIRENLRDSFTALRVSNGTDPDDPVPTTHRTLEGIVRIAEAAAKFELSETIEQRHVDIAREAVGQSMQDYGKNKDGQLDADVKETGESMPQRERKSLLKDAIQELDSETDGAGALVEDVIERVEDKMDAEQVRTDIEHEYEKGVIIRPASDEVRWVGEY